MNESTESENFIIDPAVAETVAYSAKLDRSTAAAIRLVDSIIAEHAAKKYDNTRATEKIIGAFAVYPEVFVRFYQPINPKTGFVEHEKAAIAYKLLYGWNGGGLPTHAIVSESERHDTESFDEKAGVTEAATEALLLHPPTQDFLKDFEVGNEFYLGSRSKGYEYRIGIKDVVGFHESAEFYRQASSGVINDRAKMEELYELKDTNGTRRTKLSTVQRMLERVEMYMPPDADSLVKEFLELVHAAENLETTTIGDLKKLYDTGTNMALKELEARVARNEMVYSAIVSGEASRYTSPSPDASTEKFGALNRL